MFVPTSLTRFSLRRSSARRALSVLALLLAAPGYSCQADQTSPASVEADKKESVSSPVVTNATVRELTLYAFLVVPGLWLLGKASSERNFLSNNSVQLWIAGCLWCVVQILLEHGAVSLAGRWVGADTHARMKEVQSRMNGRLPYGACSWHIGVSAIASWACWPASAELEISPIQGLIILAGTCLAAGMRTLWLYRQARRERSHAEAAARQQA